METAFRSRWRSKKIVHPVIAPRKWKNAIQALAPISDDGMVYGDFSSGSVLPSVNEYYLRPRESYAIKPVPVYVAPEPVNEEMSSEEYQAYMAQVANIAALQNPNVTYTPADLTYSQPSAPVVIDNPAPQVQFIGIDEFTAISNEGINIPADSNVIVVPVSEIHEPEIFQEVVNQQIVQPDKPIYDVVMEVIAPLSVKNDDLKQEIIFNQAVVEVKQEFPDLSINQAAVIVNETKPIPASETNAIVASIADEIENGNTIISEVIKEPVVKPADTNPLGVITDVVDNLINKTKTSINAGLIADDVKENMAKDTNGMYIAGSVVVIGVLALLFK